MAKLDQYRGMNTEFELEIDTVASEINLMFFLELSQCENMVQVIVGKILQKLSEGKPKLF